MLLPKGEHQVNGRQHNVSPDTFLVDAPVLVVEAVLPAAGEYRRRAHLIGKQRLCNLGPMAEVPLVLRRRPDMNDSPAAVRVTIS
jgi:hypothetical protein